MRKHQATGFTLVELAVVITIIAILAAILIPVFSTLSRNHRQQVCLNNLREIGVALQEYHQDYEAYPAAPQPQYLQLSANQEASAINYLPLSEYPASASLDSGNHPTQFSGELDNMDNKNALTVDTGSFKGDKPVCFQVRMKTTSEFVWSSDGGVTWTDTETPVGSDIRLENGVKISIAGACEIGDTWTFTVRPLRPKLEDGEQLQTTTIETVVATGATSVDVVNAKGLVKGMLALLCDKDSNYAEMVRIAGVTGKIVTFVDGVEYENGYAEGSTLDPRVDNFGLATLYSLGYLRKKDAEKPGHNDNQRFHCPEMFDTEEVDQYANLDAVPGARYRKFDPLWAGYNTYDFTYNYDQYDAFITEFDTAIHYIKGANQTEIMALNQKRQLRFADAPADTVVCWCYGHDTVKEPLFPTPNENMVPDATSEQQAAGLEKDRSKKKSLVLWADGTVGVMFPTFMKRAEDLNGKPAYFWVPPFLYSPGDWRK